MRIYFNKIMLNVMFNSFIFLFLIIGLQNSTNKTKINLVFNETINLPVGFIMGTSFICGSIAGSFLNFNFSKNKKLNN